MNKEIKKVISEYVKEYKYFNKKEPIITNKHKKIISEMIDYNKNFEIDYIKDKEMQLTIPCYIDLNFISFIYKIGKKYSFIQDIEIISDIQEHVDGDYTIEHIVFTFKGGC